MNESIVPKPISDMVEFKRFGHIYVRLDYNQDLNIYLYGVYQPNGYQIAWEVVKPRPSRGVMTYPSTDDFGVYGKCVSFSEVLRPKMESYFKNGW